MDEAGGYSQSTVTYQADGSWWIATVVALVCAVAALAWAGWFFFSTRAANASIDDLRARSSSLDTQITTANKWTVGTVESRTNDLLAELKTYQNVTQNRYVWSKILPLVSGSTLVGVTLTGMSVDKDLVIKVDGTAASTDGVSAFGMIARQVVAYQNAKMADPNATSVSTSTSTSVSATSPSPTATPTSTASPTTSASVGAVSTTSSQVPVFSSVYLTSINRKNALAPSGRGGTGGATGDSGTFSISLNINPVLLKPVVPKASPTPTPTPTVSPTP